jgi:uncharacterized membrane protein YeaQ/YmgE (transglycosylase-associated protein family)
MTIPSYLLGFLISTLYGTAFHLWRGGGAGRLLMNLILGWVGFWLGQFIGTFFGLGFLNIGPLNLGIATVMSFLFLASGHWLSQVEVKRAR